MFCEHRCSLEKQEEECIVGMDSSSLNLSDCCMHSSQGPAVDMSGASKLCMNQGKVEQCVGKCDCSCPAMCSHKGIYMDFLRFAGGVWMWDNSQCELVDVNLQGGTSYAVVADSKTKIHLVVSAKSMSQAVSHNHFTRQCFAPLHGKQ